MGEVGEIITGSTPSTQNSEYYSDTGILWVTPTDIVDNIIHNTVKKLSFQGAKISRVVPPESILVTCIASIGKNTMLAKTGAFNQQINGLVPNKNKYNPYFLLTGSYHWSKKMKLEASSGTMQIVNKYEFSEINTNVPNLEEQTQIGNFFKQLDATIALHKRKQKKYQQIKAIYLAKMLEAISTSPLPSRTFLPK